MRMKLNEKIAIGDTVVEKAGEIIPQVIGFIEKLRQKESQSYKFQIIALAVELDLKGMPVKQLGCPNLDCNDQVKGRLEYYASRGCMNITT